MVKRLKRDEIWEGSDLPTSMYIIHEMTKNSNLPFADFFKRKPALVPMPSSSLMKPESLWVPKRISSALVQYGFGSSVIECLKRTRAVPKAAFVSPESRPKAIAHYNSLAVEALCDADEILVIDVVTRGASMIGAINRLADAFPSARIRGFATIRTVSNSKEFKQLIDPQVGHIRLVDGETYRKP